MLSSGSLKGKGCAVERGEGLPHECCPHLTRGAGAGAGAGAGVGWGGRSLDGHRPRLVFGAVQVASAAPQPLGGSASGDAQAGVGIEPR